MKNLAYCIAPVALALTCLASTASAQESPGRRHAAEDGPRFRGGISAGGGGLFVSGYSFGMGGIDGRLGVQINNMIGVYAQPYVSFGGGKISGVTGLTGTAGGTAVVDFTFMDQIFVGAGGGGGLLGSLTGGQLHLRAGGYPIFVHGEHGARRKGLMLAIDMRVHFVSGITVLQPMASIGYEAF